jgi:hypothetical protein
MSPITMIRMHSSIGPAGTVCMLSFAIPSRVGSACENAFEGPGGNAPLGNTRLAKRWGGGIDRSIPVEVCTRRSALTTLGARLALLRYISKRFRSSTSMAFVKQISCRAAVSESGAYAPPCSAAIKLLGNLWKDLGSIGERCNLETVGEKRPVKDGRMSPCPANKIENLYFQKIKSWRSFKGGLQAGTSSEQQRTSR